MNSTDLELEVFRAGDYGPRGAWNEALLDRIAESYDAAAHEAPVTLDHDQKGPALGWVKGLRRIGDRLLATLTRLSPALVDAIRSGAYRKRSVELYRAFGTAGAPYLKAVSFLGAAAPEVKGLADPVFAEGGAEVLRFVEDAPNTDAGSGARTRLMEAGRWHPAWEREGLVEVFAALVGTPQADALERALMALDPVVAFGAEPSRANTATFAEGLFGAPATPESAALHREALRHLASRPTATYAEALLESSRNRPAH